MIAPNSSYLRELVLKSSCVLDVGSETKLSSSNQDFQDAVNRTHNHARFDFYILVHARKSRRNLRTCNLRISVFFAAEVLPVLCPGRTGLLEPGLSPWPSGLGRARCPLAPRSSCSGRPSSTQCSLPSAAQSAAAAVPVGGDSASLWHSSLWKAMGARLARPSSPWAKVGFGSCFKI